MVEFCDVVFVGDCVIDFDGDDVEGEGDGEFDGEVDE